MTQKLYAPSDAIGSNQSGLWTNTGTWQGGFLPTILDQVTINQGHTVTIPSGQTVTTGTLFDQGTLRNFGTLSLGTLVGINKGTLQTLDYKYHIRGALKAINTDANNNLTNSIFSYKLEYEDDGTYFDGNIKRQYWKSNIDGKQRAYAYTYDGDSRLKSAIFASTQAGENYALNNVDYDANGNITNLSRNGATNANFTAFGNVDNLTYTYGNNSNKLLKIQDATTANTDLGDFRDGTNTNDDYEYWADGSLKRDRNKKIASITYNYLKLPEVITFENNKTITNEYDANGTKLKKIDSNGEVTDYEEDEIYVNGNLYQTSHDEGRIANGIYEYNITDHLGNLRVGFRDSSGIAVPTQSIFYDPWGLTMKGMQVTKNPSNFNKFQFNGKEFDSVTNYNDFGLRMYDSQTGRWGVADSRAEKYSQISPYASVLNNPIMMIDPNGDTVKYVGMDTQTSAALQEQFNSYSNASPFFKKMMEVLQSSTNTINVTSGQTNGGVPGHYIPNKVAGGVGGTVTFLSGIEVTSQVTIEELAHAVQLEMRPALYPDVASSNVEYEAKLVVGIVGQDLENKGLTVMTPALNLGGLENSLKTAIVNGGTPYNKPNGALDFSTSNMATSQFQSYYSEGIKSFVESWTAKGLPFGHTYVRKPSNHQPLMIQSIQKSLKK